MVKLNEFVYSDLDSFFYNCKFKDDNSDYSYGCSHLCNEADGQCLDSACPLLFKLGYFQEDKKTKEEYDIIDNYIPVLWKSKPDEFDGYIGQQDECWGDDIVMGCDWETFRDNFQCSLWEDLDTKRRKHITKWS